MRVLLLCNKSPWPPKDGGAAATLNLIKGLSALNVSVTLLAINTSKHFVRKEDIPEALSKSIDYHLINVDTRINLIKLIFNLVFSDKPYNLERFWSETYKAELKKLISNNFDIIQVEGLSMYNYLPVIRKCTNVPMVFRPHNIENLIYAGLSMEENNPFKSLYFRVLSRRIKKVEKDILNKFDAVIPISKNDLAWMKEEGLSKPTFVMIPGVDPKEIGEYVESNSKKVFFIGALDWQPNINGLNWFIKNVWPNVVNRIPESEFIIAGRNASEKTISNFKGPNISYAGEVESSLGFIKDKSVMVVPLFSGSGIRMKIIEGMSFGKSIVATPLAAEGIEYKNGKEIFIASDAIGFADNIIRLLTNDDLRRETGENAILNVKKNYNTLASSEKLINFYRELTA
jgi:glycosyltransferase involved in cell wall biosynthesis